MILVVGNLLSPLMAKASSSSSNLSLLTTDSFDPTLLTMSTNSRLDPMGVSSTTNMMLPSTKKPLMKSFVNLQRSMMRRSSNLSSLKTRQGVFWAQFTTRSRDVISALMNSFKWNWCLTWPFLTPWSLSGKKSEGGTQSDPFQPFDISTEIR